MRKTIWQDVKIMSSCWASQDCDQLGKIQGCYSSRTAQEKNIFHVRETSGNFISWHFKGKPGRNGKASKGRKNTRVIFFFKSERSFFLIKESENCWKLISLKLMSAGYLVNDVCGNHEVIHVEITRSHNWENTRISAGWCVHNKTEIFSFHLN